MTSRFGGKVAEKKAPIPEESARILPPAEPSFAARAAERAPGGGLLLELSEQAGAVSPPCRCQVEIEHYSVQCWGGRHSNEDRVVAHRDMLPESNIAFHTVGVLDGHDTDVASDLVSSRLPGEMGRWLKEGYSVVEAYTRSMAELEEQLKAFTSSAGSCVLSCTIAGRFLWCSNLGDCRAILVPLAVPDAAAAASSGVLKPKVTGITWMSQDQKASTASERQRIHQAGGQVMDGRVEGLEPSRTLGDFDVKANVKPGVISIIPEIRRHEFVPDGATPAQAVLVCATDGVWDVLTGQDVCNLIVARKEICKLQADMAAGCEAPDRDVLKLLAEDLVQFSIAKGSRDDCTAIVSLISVPSASAEDSGLLKSIQRI